MKMFCLKPNYLLVFFILITTSFFSFAQDKQTESNFIKLLNATHSFQANFKQIVYDNHGKAIQQAQGKVYFERPDRFRWQTIQPIPQLIIANQQKLWIYDPDLEQVTIRSLKKANGEAPALLLSHSNEKLTQNYHIKILSSKMNEQIFQLIPKQSDNFSEIEMNFQHGLLNAMVLEDHLGHRTVIHFINPRANVSLSSSLFTFTPKARTDVIDETH